GNGAILRSPGRACRQAELLVPLARRRVWLDLRLRFRFLAARVLQRDPRALTEKYRSLLWLDRSRRRRARHMARRRCFGPPGGCPPRGLPGCSGHGLPAFGASLYRRRVNRIARARLAFVRFRLCPVAGLAGADHDRHSGTRRARPTSDRVGLLPAVRQSHWSGLRNLHLRFRRRPAPPGLWHGGDAHRDSRRTGLLCARGAALRFGRDHDPARRRISKYLNTLDILSSFHCGKVRGSIAEHGNGGLEWPFSAVEKEKL